jgi:hypothetical protein
MTSSKKIKEFTDILKLTKKTNDGESYLATLGLTEKIPVYVDYVEGRQWARKTDPETTWLPRFVLNITKMIVRNKKSGVLASPVKLLFRAESTAPEANVDIFNEFLDYIQKELRQEELDDKAVLDGVIKGTGVWYYYWDDQATGLDSSYIGGVRGQIIDPLDILFANPQQKDEQKQEWIAIRSREEVEFIKQIADKPDEIRSDNADMHYTASQEQEGSNLVTVYNMFFKHDGEVYVVRFTENALIHKPKPLTPRLLDEDNNEEKEPHTRITQYPIVVWNYENREKSIYGRGEVEDLIQAQRAINFTYSMMFKNVQDNAWNKWLVKPENADIEITNIPGSVLVDNYRGQGDGIKPVQPQMFSLFPVTLMSDVIEKLRAVSGSTEVISGEIPSANMSGTAIAQLQSAAERPIEDMRKRFWRAKEKIGRVLEQFFRVFYAGEMRKPFYYEEENEQGQKILQAAEFDGDNYTDTSFDVVVEAGAGTKWSEISIIQSLETMLASGKIDVESFIAAYPKSIMPNKKELLDAVGKTRQGVEAQLQQALALIQKQQEAMDSVQKIVNENRQLKEQLAVIAAAYLEAVAQNKASKKALEETVGDAQTMAQMLPTE